MQPQKLILFFHFFFQILCVLSRWLEYTCMYSPKSSYNNEYIYIVLNNLPSQVQSQVQTHEQVSGTLRKTCSHQKLSSASIDSFRSELLRPLWSCQDGWNAHVSIAKDVDIYIYMFIYIQIFKYKYNRRYKHMYKSQVHQK